MDTKQRHAVRAQATRYSRIVFGAVESRVACASSRKEALVAIREERELLEPLITGAFDRCAHHAHQAGYADAMQTAQTVEKPRKRKQG